jgi:hypothetical protein
MKILDATDFSAPEHISRVLVRDMLLLAFTQNLSLKIDQRRYSIRCLQTDGIEFECPVPVNVVPDIIATLRGLATSINEHGSDAQFLLRVPADLVVTMSESGDALKVCVAETGATRATVDTVRRRHMSDHDDAFDLDFPSGICVRR